MSIFLKILFFFGWTLVAMLFIGLALKELGRDKGRLFEAICLIGSISLYTTAIMEICYIYWLIFTK